MTITVQGSQRAKIVANHLICCGIDFQCHKNELEFNFSAQESSSDKLKQAETLANKILPPELNFSFAY
jgi:hypothetical protein